MSAYVKIPKHSLQNKSKISMRKNTRKLRIVNFYILRWSISIWCYLLHAPKFCFMISLLTAYFIVYIPYWSRNYEISLDVRGIIMLSAKIGERRKQVTALYIIYMRVVNIDLSVSRLALFSMELQMTVLIKLFLQNNLKFDAFDIDLRKQAGFSYKLTIPSIK